MAMVSLVDENRQWFKAWVRLSVCETERDVSFCCHVIMKPATMVVSDDQAASVHMGTQLLTNTAVNALVLSLADKDATLDLLISLRERKFPSDAGIPVVVMATACGSVLALRLKELEVLRLLLRPFRIRDVVQTLEALVPESSPAVRAFLAHA